MIFGFALLGGLPVSQWLERLDHHSAQACKFLIRPVLDASMQPVFVAGTGMTRSGKH